jgi:type II secretory pathway pseudopilin PulG
MSHSSLNNRQGFTIIELMLAMSFVAILLITIAMTTIQIGNIYNQGRTLKEVNEAGRSIASDIQRTIAISSPFSTDPGVGSRYIKPKTATTTRTTTKTPYIIQTDDGISTGTPIGGRLCTGKYSYVWNYGNIIVTNDFAKIPNVYSDSAHSKVLIRFVKVSDPDLSYCAVSKDTGLLPNVDFSKVVELLDASEHNLAIHSFTISSTDTSSVDTASDSATNQRLYSIEFLLGTNDWGNGGNTSTLTESGDTTACKPPNEQGSDPYYCSVVQFNILARTGNAS